MRLLPRKAAGYLRQEVWQALGCLIGPQKFRDRLVSAAGPLSELKYLHPHLLTALPDDTRERLASTIDALTNRPSDESVLDLTPRKRAAAAQAILAAFEAVVGGV